MNKHSNKKLKADCGSVGKTVVIGVKERETKQVKAKVIEDFKRPTLHGFIGENVELGATVYTDDLSSYENLKNYEHGTVKHSISEYVDEKSISMAWNRSDQCLNELTRELITKC